MLKAKKQVGEEQPHAKFRIKVMEKGPYLVFGHPPLSQQFIMPDKQGDSWYFQQGVHFTTDDEPTALCRCGASHRKPYCDGSHVHTAWNPELTSPAERLLDQVDVIEGETLTLTDNEKYCVFARFCDPHGDTWTLTEKSADPQARRLAVREASMCPSARLTAWDNKSDRAYEFKFTPSLGLIEDPIIGVSGGVWVRGGVPIIREQGESYEIRNRVVLCRCGASDNKPYCDGTHVAVKWRDGLEGEPAGETLPETVY